MNRFDRLRNDKVTLVKESGETLEDIRAGVSRDRISMAAPLALAVEEGDVLRREVPGGVVEEYVVLDAGYSSGHGRIPPSYSAHVRKKSAVDARPSPVVYNVHVTGSNARFNLHSVDLSSNIQDVNTPDLFKKLREVLSEVEVLEKRRTALLMQLDKMEEAAGTTSFSEHYKGFVSLAADHMTLLAPFIPALSQLLG